jgi:phenylalanyl-tRNA synthetase beta subunit
LVGFLSKSTWSNSRELLSWFEAKGKIEQFFKQLNLVPKWETCRFSENNEIFHPYCTANLYLDNKTY